MSSSGMNGPLIYTYAYKKVLTHGQPKWWASQATAQGINLKGHKRCYWNNQKYGAGKLRFSHAEEFL
jgi:hypothetical protein